MALALLSKGTVNFVNETSRIATAWFPSSNTHSAFNFHLH